MIVFDSDGSCWILQSYFRFAVTLVVPEFRSWAGGRNVVDGFGRYSSWSAIDSPQEELPLEALDINNLVQEEDFESVRTGQLERKGFQFAV